MAPHAPGTEEIETLLWIGFAAATIVVVAVVAGLALALLRSRGRARGGGEPPQATGGRRLQLRAAAALTAFAAAVLVVSAVFTEAARETPATGPRGLQETSASEPLRIEATGQRWLWRYDYPNEAFSYYKLTVPVDTTVELSLASTDVVHTWDVPELAPKRDAVPGKGSSVVFRADEEGVYLGQSATLSGQGYAAMRTAVEVVSPAEYEAAIEQLAEDIQAAQEKVTERIEGGETP